jgi:miniconductance mechanosensitive channel
MSDNFIYQFYLRHNLDAESAHFWTLFTSTALIILIIIVATLVIRQLLLRFLLNWIKGNKYQWDDALLKNQVIKKISWFIPIILVVLSIDILIPTDSSLHVFLKRMMQVFAVIVGVLSINAILSSTADIYRLLRKKRADMLQGFIDAAKIITYIVGVIFIISIFSGMTPFGIISVLGGMTAVTMLVFKDTIVGFVASIQLTTTDMVRVGDWVELPAYGADGDVISMSIHTIRVQNWDKTITTVPTYALVANSFKNWRGMSDSGGRRIKRALMLDINSIRFCDTELLSRFEHIRLLKDYLASKSTELEDFNRTHDFEDSSLLINGRRQTNIGVFRAYVIAYLKSNPVINQDMTFLVRQLAPTQYGLPLEIYVFSSDQRWAHYENIQADIFDHLFAALSDFDLRAFQNPSGFDMKQIGCGATGETAA